MKYASAVVLASARNSGLLKRLLRLIDQDFLRLSRERGYQFNSTAYN